MGENCRDLFDQQHFVSAFDPRARSEKTYRARRGELAGRRYEQFGFDAANAS